MPTQQAESSLLRMEEKFRNKPGSLVFCRLADHYRKSGDVMQAIFVCQEGLKSHPENVTGRIILGRCYLEQENFTDAIKEFTQVCQLDRRNQIAIKMLADIFSKQGMEEKAGDLYAMLFAMDPENGSLGHLTSVFKGSLKSNLLEILGLEGGKSFAGAAVQPPASGTLEDEVLDETPALEGDVASIDTELKSILGDSYTPDITGAADAAAGLSIPADGIQDAGDFLSESAFGHEHSQAASLETAKEAVPEPPDIEVLGEDEADHTHEHPVASLPQDAHAEDEQLTMIHAGEPVPVSEIPVPAVDDISQRMDVMFGEGEELIPEQSALAIGETLIPSEQEPAGDATPLHEAKVDAFDEGDTFDMRVQSLFGDESATVSLPSALETWKTAAEEPAEEAMVTEETLDTELSWLEEEAQPSAADQVIPELAEQTAEQETEGGDQAESGPDTLNTEATAVYDREMIRRIAEAERNKQPARPVERTVKEKVPEQQTGVSGEEVFSRLDEMFPAEGEPEAFHEGTLTTRDIGEIILPEGGAANLSPDALDELPGEPSQPLTPAVSLETGMLDLSNSAFIGGESDSGGTKDRRDPLSLKKTQSFSMDALETHEELSGEEVAERIDSMFGGAEKADALALPDEEIADLQPAGEFYTESGETAIDESETGSSEEQAGEAVLEGDLPVLDRDTGSDIFGMTELIAPGAGAGDETNSGILNISDLGLPDDFFAAKSGDTLAETKAESAGGFLLTGESDAESIAEIPDEPDGETAQVGEFYTESGAGADLLAPSTAENSDESEQESGAADTILRSQETSEGPVTPALDEHEISLDMIPDDEPAETAQAGEFYTESGGDAAAETAVTTREALLGTLTEDSPEAMESTGESGDAAVSSVSGEGAETGIEAGVFYTGADGLPAEEPVMTDAAGEVVMDSPTDDEFYSISGEPSPVPGSEALETDSTLFSEHGLSQGLGREAAHVPGEIPGREETPQEMIVRRADAIPDHVLTPTLADIYYQQDQPYLAVQIYRRLLERNPDNERIARRITEIEARIKEREIELEQQQAVATETGMARVPVKKTRKRKAADQRPLKGIKIKKKVKERIKGKTRE